MADMYMVKGHQLIAITNALRTALGTEQVFRSTEIPEMILQIGKYAYDSQSTIKNTLITLNPNMDYLISKKELTNITNAIRARLNTTNTYTIDEIPNAINLIYTNKVTNVSNIENI